MKGFIEVTAKDTFGREKLETHLINIKVINGVIKSNNIVEIFSDKGVLTVLESYEEIKLKLEEAMK